MGYRDRVSVYNICYFNDPRISSPPFIGSRGAPIKIVSNLLFKEFLIPTLLSGKTLARKPGKLWISVRLFLTDWLGK